MSKEMETMTKKPVSACGCDTDHNDGEWVTTAYNGKRIYFCTESCLKEFDEDPVKFLESDHFVLSFDLLEDA